MTTNGHLDASWPLYFDHLNDDHDDHNSDREDLY